MIRCGMRLSSLRFWTYLKQSLYVILLIIFCGQLAAKELEISEQLYKRFHCLTKKLRCHVCVNQSLFDSNAPLSQDMKNLIASKMQSGESDQEIVDYLVLRYGDRILYTPRLNQWTVVLWLLPIILLVSIFLHARQFFSWEKQQ